MPTNIYDVTQPPDTQLANLLGLDLRNLALNVQERMALISGTLGARWNPATDAQPTNWTGLLYFATDTQQLFQWNGSAWVDISTFFAQQIVITSLNLAGRNAAIPSTLFYSVPAGKPGIYRVSSDIVITGAGGAGYIESVYSWNNGAGNASVVLALASVLAIGNEGGTPNVFDFYAAGGTSINYSTTYVGVTGTPVYSLRARLEYLG